LLADRDAAILTASRARSGKPWYLERAETLDQTARRYATTFELPAPAAMPDLADLRKAASEVKAANKARDAARAAVRAAELEAQLAEREARKRKDKARVAAWVAGRGERFPYTWIDGPTRLRKRADFLETSRGAEVPWPHAVRAFEAVKQVRASGIPFAANGRTIHLGHFTLDAIDKAGNVVAGCHRVEWKEIARLMKKEGVL
jgi:multidrug efflux pump subunit AcrA (membrane-fusion protein)